MQLLRPEGVLIPLIKPQFELRREDVGKGGVVRDSELHQRAVLKIETFVRQELGRKWEGCIPSPIRGGEGNQEFLACVRNASA
jgi:23S rRNA (cytidine1920-2'-O)/16S rRNA (cytidine1409-2'-O)-methyltransferase